MGRLGSRALRQEVARSAAAGNHGLLHRGRLPRLRCLERIAEPTVGRLLIPLGRNSFYVFIMQVFVCLGVASVPALGGDGLGLAANTVVQVACLALLWLMVRRRLLFGLVPR